ncbi:MAG: transferase [Verrucomicrobia bacterium]|nr:transferase [Cytophagales bacterium]
MYLLFPGRHHLLTNFQFNYLFRLIQSNLGSVTDINGRMLEIFQPVEAIIFAVTSANHSHTRRNPLPFYLRAIQLEDFADDLPVPTHIFGIDEVGILKNFADYTLKRIAHDSDGKFILSPENTLVVCSTPVMAMYETLGFKILPAELSDRKKQTFAAPVPWDVVEKIAGSTHWLQDTWVIEHIHPASVNVWKRYGYAEKVQILFRDKIIGEDGDITETRDYNSYVRQMDEIAELKFKETETHIREGRIGDIGCAVGSWIKLACLNPVLQESDFYGIEVSRHLYALCQQRKMNGEFGNPFVFFAQKNAVTGLVFEKNSMHTIHTSSLTHEIESYGNREDLLKFIKNRFEELTFGGIWINRDVVAPENPDEMIVMELSDEDGRNQDWEKDFDDRQSLANYLQELSTYSRFLRFVRDFRRKEGDIFEYGMIRGSKKRVGLKLRNAMEFVMKKDYTDNWQSEMHEKFCFWTFEDWKQHLEAAGFFVLSASNAYTNDWIVKNRLEGSVTFYKQHNKGLQKMDFPVTHTLLLAEKRLI